MTSGRFPDPNAGWVPPAPPHPPSGHRRGWDIFAAAAASAFVAGTAAVVITAHVVAQHSHPRGTAAATVTVTAPPPTAPTPAPLPTTQADRQTCNAWHAAGDKIHAASRSISELPDHTTILDPQVRTNPAWSAAVARAADFYGQAGDILSAGIAHGTSVILSKTAAATAAALQALSTSEVAFDVTNGNAYDAVHNSADSMDVLCERLAPR